MKVTVMGADYIGLVTGTCFYEGRQQRALPRPRVKQEQI